MEFPVSFQAANDRNTDERIPIVRQRTGDVVLNELNHPGSDGGSGY
jgi:hypothetical protein